MTDLAGVVLCGGAGRRLGRDKALLEISGEPLVRRVSQRLSTVADPVLVAAGERDLPELPYERVHDARVGAGPLGGIVAALRSIDAPALATVAVDMPHASPAVFSLLARLRTEADAVVPRDDHGLQPLHALYDASCLQPFEHALADEDFSMHSALARVRVREVTQEEWAAADPSGRFAFNINVAEDLAEI